MIARPVRRSPFVLCSCLGLAVACGGSSLQVPGSTPQNAGHPRSLVEHWGDARIAQPTATPSVPPRAELRFDGHSSLEFEWRVVDGVADLRVEDGLLVGRATTETPVILLELSPDEAARALPAKDSLWSVELRLRASAGSTAGVHPLQEPGPPIPVVVARANDWPLSSPIIAGEETKTYTVVLDKVFTLEMPLAEQGMTTIALRPTNIAGATFGVESLRLVFRNERLATIPSGPGWHGLGEVFRETVVTRTPEVVEFPAILPDAPWLDLSIGAVGSPPPEFRVVVTEPGNAPAVAAAVSPEAPDQWHSTRVDLSPWAGKAVELRLEATADQPGTLAFWGGATIRNSLRSDGSHSSAETAARPPQTVIVFLADTLRPDHLEAWGHGRDTAPTVARLAATGARFDDAVAQATWTKVSVSSILTSLYPSTTGVVDLNDRVSAAETTLAEAFRAAGYATFATSSVPFSGQLTNLHQGVEAMHEFGAQQSPVGFQSKSAKGWVDAYLAWLELHHDVPTFALVHVMDPHSPFEPPAPYDALWAPAGAKAQFKAWSEQLAPHIKSPLLRRFMAPSHDELAAGGVDAAAFVAHETAWYDGSIRGMDAQLERLMTRVGQLGLEQRTVLAFVADHGEEFLEHGHHWHGTSVYGELANVPLFFWGQGVPAGVVVDGTVQTIDLMPTLLDLAGIEIPERAQGHSLLPRLRDGASERSRPAFTEHRAGDDPGEHDSFAILDEDWKLIWNLQPPAGKPTYELYRHREDRLDQNNVADAHPDVVERLASDLERWQGWAVSQKLDTAAVESAMSSEELERLRSLGYID